MNLYELAPQIIELQQRAEEMSEDELSAALAELETKGVAIVGNVVRWIRGCEAAAQILDDEEARLAERRASFKRRSESLRRYLLGYMQATHATKIDAEIATVSRRKASSSVVVDESQTIEWPEDVQARCVTHQVKVNKAELKRIPGYNKLPGVTEVEGEESIQIR